MYNLSRECTERLVKATDNLSHWIEARTSLVTSIVAQKAGLFHHQNFFQSGSVKNRDKTSESRMVGRKSLALTNIALNRKISTTGATGSTSVVTNPYVGDVSYVDALVKNITPPKQMTPGGISKSPLPTSLAVKNIIGSNANRPVDSVYPEVYRDTKPPKPLHLPAKSNKTRDPIFRQGQQMLELRAADKKHIMRNLYNIWSTNAGDQGPIYPSSLEQELWTQEVLDHFQEIAILKHWAVSYTHLTLPTNREV